MLIISSNNGHFEVNGKQIELHNAEMIWKPLEETEQDREWREQWEKFRRDLLSAFSIPWRDLGIIPTGPIVEGSIEEMSDGRE